MMKKIFIFLTIFITFSYIFIFFHSNTYTAADGSIGSVEVFYLDKPFIHGNNHMLFPAHIYYFNKVLSMFGIKSHDPFEFFRYSSIMNAIAASLSLSIIFFILHMLTTDYFFSIIGLLLAGFNNCFMLQATNPNEPMVGILFSTLSVFLFLLSLRKKKIIYSCFSGICLSYAMATYQSMVSIFPAMIIIYCGYILHDKVKQNTYIRLIVFFILFFCMGLLLIYGICYSVFYNINTLNGFIHRFLNLDGTGGGVWGGFKLKNLIIIFFGLILAFFKMPFHGIKQLLTSFTLSWFFLILLFCILILLLCYVYIITIQRNKKILLTSLSILLFFIFPSFCLIFWDPDYYKLWIQPSLAFIVFIMYILTSYLKLGVHSVLKYCFIIFLIMFEIIMIQWNYSYVLSKNHKGEKEVVEVVSSFNAIIEKDSVVFTEWDKAGLIFKTFFKSNRMILDIAGIACSPERNRLITIIDDTIHESIQQKREIYFLGVLSIPLHIWKPFLEQRVGIPYNTFQKYRDRAVLIKRINTKEEEYFLYQYK